MSSLVDTFERKLACTSSEAAERLLGLFLLTVVVIVVATAAVVLFPYESGTTEEISILAGNHEEVLEILDGQALVGGQRFLELSEGKTTLIALGDEVISYMVKADGISYRHNQSVHLDQRYMVHAQEIRGDTVTRILHRHMAFMWAMNITVPAFVILLMLALAYQAIHSKQNGIGRSLFDGS